MVTFALPLDGPSVGVIFVIVGAGTYVNTSVGEAVEVSFEMLTVTSTVPADAPGETAVQLVVEAQLTPAAAFVPKSTVVPPELVENPVPVIEMEVPPETGPKLGESAVTVGGEGDDAGGPDGGGPDGGGPDGGGPELLAAHWA